MPEVDRRGRDPLHYAAASDDVETVTARLDAGVDVDLADTLASLTPLHFAVGEGAAAAAAALLDRGADLEARTTPRGMTPLIHATSRWRAAPDGAVLRVLLERGADRSAREKNGKTAFDVSSGLRDFPDGLRTLLAPDV